MDREQEQELYLPPLDEAGPEGYGPTPDMTEKEDADD